MCNILTRIVHHCSDGYGSEPPLLFRLCAQKQFMYKWNPQFTPSYSLTFLQKSLKGQEVITRHSDNPLTTLNPAMEQGCCASPRESTQKKDTDKSMIIT